MPAAQRRRRQLELELRTSGKLVAELQLRLSQSDAETKRMVALAEDNLLQGFVEKCQSLLGEGGDESLRLRKEKRELIARVARLQASNDTLTDELLNLQASGPVPTASCAEVIEHSEVLSTRFTTPPPRRRQSSVPPRAPKGIRVSGGGDVLVGQVDVLSVHTSAACDG